MRELNEEERKKISWNSTGAYGTDALEVQRQLGRRWLRADYDVDCDSDEHQPCVVGAVFEREAMIAHAQSS